MNQNKLYILIGYDKEFYSDCTDIVLYTLDKDLAQESLDKILLQQQNIETYFWLENDIDLKQSKLNGDLKYFEYEILHPRLKYNYEIIEKDLLSR